MSLIKFLRNGAWTSWQRVGSSAAGVHRAFSFGKPRNVRGEKTTRVAAMARSGLYCYGARTSWRSPWGEDMGLPRS